MGNLLKIKTKKMKINFFKLIVAITFLPIVISCHKDENKGIEDKDAINYVEEELIQANNIFGLNLFKEVIGQEENDKNIFISPLSVSLALAMTYNGSDGLTKEAFKSTLGFEGLESQDINESFKQLVETLLTLDEKVILNIANSIWPNEGFEVLQEFIDLNYKYYNAEVNKLNFADPQAVNIINGWIAEKTNNKIQKALDGIPPDAVLYLINAIYFKGIWQYEFDEEHTRDKTFYLEDGSQPEVPTMIQEKSFYYTKNDLFEAIELPYGNGNYSMIIILPDYEKTTEDVVSEINEENWKQWLNSFKLKDKIQVELPKFKFIYGTKELNNELINLGLGIAFGPGADFTKINPYGGIFISRVLHKSFVEVNEEGTEAAAVTIVEVVAISALPGPEKIYFKVNRPFIFVIKEKQTNAILFMGRVMKPVIES